MSVSPAVAKDPKWQKTWASASGYRSVFSRTRNDCGLIIDALKLDPTSYRVGQGERALDRLEEQRNRCQDVYTELLCEFPSEENKINERINSLPDEFNAMSTDLQEAIKVASVPAAPALAAGPAHTGGTAAHAKTKMHDALKPFTLTLDHSPAEMRDWTQQLTSYYSASQLSALPVEDQRAYFLRSIDSKLATQIRKQLQASTPVFETTPGEHCCVSAIEAVFLMRYPLYNRRMDFFTYAQAPGQSFEDYGAELERLADEADIHVLKMEDLLVFRYLCAATDEKLKERLMKLSNPTLVGRRQNRRDAQ